VRQFWPCREAAQADYERLRERVLAGVRDVDLVAVRFERRGLAGLIAQPSAEPAWVADLIGARRLRWSPHTDLRVEGLADSYAVVRASLLTVSQQLAEVQA
jgi:hypothetical protein